MTRDLVIIGCGGFGREVVGIVDATNASSLKLKRWNLLGFLDDAPNENAVESVKRLSLSILGPVDESSLLAGMTTYFVVGIGDGVARRNVTRRAESFGMKPATLIHPFASIGRDVRVGAGAIVAAGAQITTNVHLGDHVHIDRASHVGHDSNIGEFSTIHPMAVVSGNCHIGTGVELGTNCTILPGVTIGHGAIVGAAACVVRDVPAATTVKGIPAR